MPIVTAAVHRGFGSRREPLPLTFRHWAGVSPYTSPSGFAETCVFGKQSPGPAPAPAPPGTGPLLPKLRGQLAEFLDGGSLVHLGTLVPAHQCRCAVRTAPSLPPRLFSPVRARSRRFDTCRHSRHGLPPAATHPVHLARATSPPGSPRRSPTGNWGRTTNRLSIAASPRGCGLGPPNPTRIARASEPLGFRWDAFAASFTLLMPAFALQTPPPALPPGLRWRSGRSPTNAHLRAPQHRWTASAPFIVGAAALDQ